MSLQGRRTSGVLDPWGPTGILVGSKLDHQTSAIVEVSVYFGGPSKHGGSDPGREVKTGHKMRLFTVRTGGHVVQGTPLTK